MTNQIIEVPDISIVITIDGTKQLLSLREQKIKKDTLQNFGAGSGVKYQDNLYILNKADETPEIIKAKVVGDYCGFTISKADDIIVDWGDGNIDHSNNFVHSYNDGLNEHTVSFKGSTLSLLRFQSSNFALKEIYFFNNINLDEILIYKNQVSVVQAVSCPVLSLFKVYETNITELDLRYMNKIQELIISANPLLVNVLLSDSVYENLSYVEMYLSEQLEVDSNFLTKLAGVLPDRNRMTEGHLGVDRNYKQQINELIGVVLSQKNWRAGNNTDW